MAKTRSTSLYNLVLKSNEHSLEGFQDQLTDFPLSNQLFAHFRDLKKSGKRPSLSVAVKLLYKSSSEDEDYERHCRSYKKLNSRLKKKFLDFLSSDRPFALGRKLTDAEHLFYSARLNYNRGVFAKAEVEILKTIDMMHEANFNQLLPDAWNLYFMSLNAQIKPVRNTELTADYLDAIHKSYARDIYEYIFSVSKLMFQPGYEHLYDQLIALLNNLEKTKYLAPYKAYFTLAKSMLEINEAYIKMDMTKMQRHFPVVLELGPALQLLDDTHQVFHKYQFWNALINNQIEEADRIQENYVKFCEKSNSEVVFNKGL